MNWYYPTSLGSTLAHDADRFGLLSCGLDAMGVQTIFFQVGRSDPRTTLNER